MIRIEEEVDISCPVQEVFSFMAKIENHQAFCGAFTQTRQLSAGALGLGTLVQKKSSFIGKEMVVEQEVIAYEPNQLISLKNVSGPVSGQEHYVFTERGEGAGTRLKVMLLSKPPTIFSLAAPILKAKIKHQLRADLYSLKEMLESGRRA